jgi:diacylglycerol kinase (ATP)
MVVGTGAWERLALVLALLAVLCIEFLNTAIEKLCDHVTPDRHEAIKAIKAFKAIKAIKAIRMRLLKV